MSTVIAQAQILLTANTARFTQGMADARSQASSSMADIRANALEMGAKVKAGFGMANAAIGAVSTAVGFLVKDQYELANSLARTAQIANTSAVAIQKYTFAAKAMGIEQDKLGDIFKDTQDKVGDFLTTGGGELQDFFDNVAPQIGLTAEAMREFSGPQALQSMYDAMEKANLSQSEMIFYIESIADEASLLIPLLANGGEGFRLWAEAAENAGAVMDAKTIRASQELKASTELLTLSYQGAKNQIAQAFIPVLGDLASALVQDANVKNQAKVAGEYLAQSFKVIAMTGVGVVVIVTSIGKAIGGAMAALAQFGRIAEGVDLTSPFAMFQIGKNVLWDIPKSQLEILQATVLDIGGTLAQADKTMEWINNLGKTGTNARINSLVSLQNHENQIIGLRGKTGKQLQDERNAAEEAAKANDKLAKSKEKSAAIYKNEEAAWSKVLNNASKYNFASLEKQYSLPSGLLAAIHMQESHGNPNATGPMTKYGRAKGGFQFIDDTWARYGKGSQYDLANAAPAAAKYLRKLIDDFGDVNKAIAAYNTGEGNVKKYAWSTIMSDRYARMSNGKGQTYHYVLNASRYLGAYNGGTYQNYSAKDVLNGSAQAQAEAERHQQEALRQAQQIADKKAALEQQLADKQTQIWNAYQAKRKEVMDLYTDENDPKRGELLAKYENDYRHDVAAFKLAQDKKAAALDDFRKSERDKALEDATFRAREIGLDQDLNDQSRKMAWAANEEHLNLKLKTIDLAEAREKQAANAAHQTNVENIKAEAQLQRDELDITMGLDADLRQAKLNAINEAEQLSLDKARQDFENELASLTDYSKTELQKLRDEYRGKRSILDARTDISDAQKSDLRNAMAASEIYFASQLKKPAADAFNGLNAEMSGTSELVNLQNQLNQRLDIIKKAKAAEVIATEQAEMAKAKIEHDYWYASYQLQVSQSASIADNVASMGKIMLGEQSRSYKALFAASQSFVMAQAGLNMYKAISDGWAQGTTLPQKLAAATVAGTEMLKIIQAAQQVKMQGFAAGGYTGDIPTNAVAGLVHGGEYVFDANATKQLGRKNLDSLRKGEGFGNTTVNVNVIVNGDGSSSVESQQQLGKNIGDAVNAAVQKALIKERRQGGLLAGAR